MRKSREMWWVDFVSTSDNACCFKRARFTYFLLYPLYRLLRKEHRVPSSRFFPFNYAMCHVMVQRKIHVSPRTNFYSRLAPEQPDQN